MKTFKISEFKAKALSIMEEVAKYGEPVLVTKRGKPLAKVLPADSESTKNLMGTLARTVIYMADDIITPCYPEPEELLESQFDLTRRHR